MKKFMKAALALATIAMVGIGSTQPADAGNGRGAAVAGGIIGGLALGAILSGPRGDYVESCYDGPPRCRVIRECYENRFGDRTCDSRRECIRDSVCD